MLIFTLDKKRKIMKHLTKEQRYQIKAYLNCGKSKFFIAEALKVHVSTIYREIKRNATKTGKYRPEFANELANEQKERFRTSRGFDDQTKKTVENYIIKEQWSPEQIVGYCKKENIKIVSHETIYAYIRKDKAKGGKLYKHLRHKLKHRKRPLEGKKSVIKDKVSIELRDQVINNKERFGDWEIDLIVGPANKGAIVTIVERTTAYFMMKKLKKGKNAKGLAEEVIEMLIPYKDFVHSITSDNGSEFAEHKKIAAKISADFFFAHPYASWERGLSEYTNKLVRQYIPKKQSFENLSDKQITEYQYKINNRPRKKLYYEKPKKIFFKFVNKKFAFAS
jgi:transposase, IS30 family